MLAHFKEKDKFSAPSHHSESSSKPLSTSSLPPAPPASTLVVPPSPELLDNHDYYAVPFWDHEKWKVHEKKERANGRIPSRLGFLTDTEGNAVSSARLSQMVGEANVLWNSMYSAREDPPSWKKKTKIANDYFSNSLRSKFIEFQLCEGDYKVEVFASTKFSDWNRNSREKGNLKRMLNISLEPILITRFVLGTMPSINIKAGTGKRKNGDVDAKPRLPKKIKTEAPVVLGDVINLDSDGADISDNRSAGLVATSSATLASAAPSRETPTRTMVFFLLSNAFVLSTALLFS
jgi:hypothetical protein